MKIEIKNVELIEKPEGLNEVLLRVEFLCDGAVMIMVSPVSNNLYQDKDALDKALILACKGCLDTRNKKRSI